MTFFTLSFYILGILAILGAIGMLVSRHPMRSAVFLLSVMLVMAFLYALLSAPFMAALQLIIYAGTIMTMIVFIVALVDVKGDDLKKVFSRITLVAILVVVAFSPLAILFCVRSASGSVGDLVIQFGTIQAISQKLLSQYLLHFEVASLLLFVGIVGVSTLRGKKDSK